MDRTSPATGYARLTPRQARAVLALLVATCGFFVAVTLSPLAQGYAGKDRPGQSDVALYRAEVDRIHAGEGYYQVAAAELTARGYPTRSVFNWRTPLPMWLIGRLPSVVLGKAMLGGLALGLFLAAFEALAREEQKGDGPRLPERSSGCFAQTGTVPFLRPLACVLLLTGPLMLCILGDLFVMPVLWGGVLIALSLCAYGLDRRGLGVVLGLAALLVRDLVLPYCLLAAGIAWWTNRRVELRAWLLGLTAWLGLFALHGWYVWGLITPQAVAHCQGWIRFGGAGFVIATAQVNAYLLLLPQWVAALYLVAAMFGFAGWHTPLGLRAGLTACLFVAAFAAVGHEFNQYWGSLIAPLLCFGVARLPASLSDLFGASNLAAGVSPCEPRGLSPR